MDGLGGYADAEHGTELEEAVTPNLDQLAAEGSAGLVEPIGPGITPGFGAGPPRPVRLRPRAVRARPGRALGGGPRLRARSGRRRRPRQPRHARARRHDHRPPRRAHPRRGGAGSSSTGSRPRCTCPGVEVFFRHEREHRLLVVLRGAGLDARLGDTDPQQTGVPPLAPSALAPEAKRTADLVVELDAQIRARARRAIRRPTSCSCAASTRTASCPSFEERYGLHAAAIAIYPMYRGIARLLGMDVLGRPADLTEQLGLLRDVVERLRLLLPAPQVHRLGG